jgi:ribonucleotide reductase alpha subunit
MVSKYESLSEERKYYQDIDELPEWFTTAGWQLFKDKYTYGEDTTFRKRATTIARTLAKHTYDPAKYEDKFFQLLWKGWLSASTPVLANTGTNRGLPVSCSGGVVGDSIEGFYSSRLETALLTKHGFGTSGYLGDIRPRGSAISVGGVASGVLPVIKGFVQDSQDVSQGSTRRGSFATYLPVEHGDFWEVITYLENHPDDLNIGWNIGDSFVAALQSGDPEAQARYGRMLKVKMVTGKGYFNFIDKINRARPPEYVNNGLTVKASNLCVAPETKILTKQEGYIEIAALAGQAVDVWNGEEWSEVVVAQTSKSSKLLTVSTSSAQPLVCTPEHIFYVQDDYHSAPRSVPAKALKAGDRLIKFDLPVIEGDEEDSRAYASGFFSGDGCFYQGNKITYLYGEKRKLLSRFAGLYRSQIVQENQDRVVLHHCAVWDKFRVPTVEYTIETRLDWLSGLPRLISNLPTTCN